MDTTGTPTALLAVLVVLVVGCLVAVALTSVRGRRDRREAAAELAAARAETARLAARLDALDEQAARQRGHHGPDAAAAYVITDAGAPDDVLATPDPRPMVRDTVVLNAALGEPLLRAAALTHGVRRALSPESRARVRAAVRQETKRSRKQRRREMRELWLAHKRAERAEARAARATPAPTARPADAA